MLLAENEVTGGYMTSRRFPANPNENSKLLPSGGKMLNFLIIIFSSKKISSGRVKNTLAKAASAH